MIVRRPTKAIHKYILYYCILYLSTQTYSLAVRVYLPAQRYNMYPSREILISVQKYKLHSRKISPILSTQITAPVKKKIYQSFSTKT